MRVFIVGSCVSRDAFTTPNNATVTEYVARTSLVSAFAPTPWNVDDRIIDDAISSPFQRRLVKIDMRKELRSLLHNTYYDLILLDFIDERFDLIELDGKCATCSNEFSLTKLQDTLDANRIDIADPHRNHRWQKGLSELLALAFQRRVPVFLNRVFWAERDNAGYAFNISSVKRMNNYLTKLYSTVPNNVHMIEHLPSTMVGDVGHVWGRSPVHFCREAYETVLSSLGVKTY